VANECNERSEEQLRDGHGVARGGIDDGDAEGGRFGDVDVVGADAGTADDLEASGASQELGGKLGGAAADDGVIAADDVEEVPPGGGGALIDAEARVRAQELDAVGVDFVGDEDMEGAHQGPRAIRQSRFERNVPVVRSFLQIPFTDNLYFQPTNTKCARIRANLARFC